MNVTCPHCRSTVTITDNAGWCDTCKCPILVGKPDGGLIEVWCRYCNCNHTHGRCVSGAKNVESSCRHYGHYGVPCTCPPGTGDGHRHPHCTNMDSPYRDTGYIVVEAPAIPAARARRSG